MTNNILNPSAILYKAPIHIEEKLAPYSDDDISMIKNICPENVWIDPQGNLFKGEVIKAVAVRENNGVYYPSSVVVNSYFVSSDIKNKFNLPVISITMDNNDLFSDSIGIFRNYNGSGKEWERPAYMEFYESDGTLGFKRGIGVRVHGAHSRVFQQKSLNIYFKSGYDESGTSSITYPLIPGNVKQSDKTTPLNTYKGFVLRQSSDDEFYTLFRDAIAHKINSGLDAYGAAYRPSVVFLNGEFWGIYNIREHYNDDYFETSLGVDEDKNGLMFLEFEGNKVPTADVPGDERGYIEFLIRLGCQNYKDLPEYSDIYAQVGDSLPDMNDPAVYDYVKQNIDIDNFIDYNIANIYFANIDWPFNNVKMWRVKNPTGSMPSTWQFMLNDLDYGLGLVYNDYQTDTFRFAFGSYRYHWYNPDWGTFLLERLKENDDFRTRFISRFATLLSTYYAPSRTAAMVDDSKNMINDAVFEQRQRNVALIDGATAPYTEEQIMTKFNNDVVEVKEFLEKRPYYVNEHLKSFFELENSVVTLNCNQNEGNIKISGVDIKEGTPGVTKPSAFSANYFKNIPIEISVQEKSGYEFLRFEVKQGNVTRVYNTSTATIIPTSDKVEIVAKFNKDNQTTQEDNIIAAGENGVLSIEKDGELYFTQNSVPQKIMDNAESVWASGQYYFAKKTDNSFYVWGNEIKEPWFIGNDIKMATAGNKIAYLKTDSKVYILGENEPFAENVEKLAAYGDDFYYIANGKAYKKGSSIAIKEDVLDIAANQDGLYALGNDEKLYLGINTILEEVNKFSVGKGHVLAQKLDGDLYGFGDNKSKQLEDSNLDSINEFIKISKKPVCFSAGGDFSAIADNNGVVIMGGGICATGVNIPDKCPPLNLITAGESHVTFTLGGKVYSWGGNDMAQLGNGFNRYNYSVKKELYMLGSGLTLNDAVGVSAGMKQGLAIRSNGALIGWGNGESYNLTRNNNITFVDGAEIAQNVSYVVSGKNHTMYVSNSNVLYGAGSNDKCKLGISGEYTKTFKEIMSNIFVAGAGESHSVALALDGTLYGFGDNTFGQLGAGVTQFNTPTPILNDVKMAWASYNMTLILKTDGSLWGMGDAPNGQFGTENATTSSTLIHIADNVKSASVSNTHILVLKEDGSLWSAGCNANGELGLVCKDVNMHGLTKVMDKIAYIAAGSGFSAVMAEDGSVYTWGANDKGQLGCGDMNSTYQIKNPISVGSLNFTGSYYNNNLEDITTLNGNKYVMAKISVDSSQACEKIMNAVIAIYDKNGKMLSLNMQPVTAKGNGKSQIRINTYIHDKNAVKLKVMLLDTQKELCPLINLPALE